MNDTLLFDTTRFGTVGYTDADVVLFNDGPVGFPEHRRFLLLCHKPDSPFRWLQSLDEPQLAFLITDPASWVPTYAPTISDADVERLGLIASAPRLVYVTVTIPPGKPEEMTVNLAGPILIDLERRLAIQLVLQDETYTTKHRVFPQANRVSVVAA
ncbi:MAG: flagellar assembly protein FliW [Fimbriimonadaceae bacterium]